jgi:hypothetical protein
MSVMEKLRSLFQRTDLPDETRQLYQDAASPRDLIKGLETLRGRNEIELRENEEQLIGLEKAVSHEEDSIRRGGLTPTEETIILRRIERLEKQRANLGKQVLIYNENVNLHLNLIAKIQEMEAMRSRGVGEDQIDRLVDEVGEHVEEYKRVGFAAEAGAGLLPAVDESAERRRLEEIKKRIVGTKQERGPEAAAEPLKERKRLED